MLNIGLEGMMLLGAFVGFYVAGKTQSLPIAFAAATGVGLLLALLSGTFTVKLGADQVVVGTRRQLPCTWSHRSRLSPNLWPIWGN